MDKKDKSKLISSFVIAGVISIVLVLIHVIITLGGISPGMFGVIPREVEGLPGILTSPWVHGDWSHLFSNLGPIFVLLSAMLYFYRKAAVKALVWMYLMTGIWVWVAAHNGSHIGASGMVYALAFYIFFSGVIRRDTRSIAVSLVIAFFYGSLVWGVLPTQPGVSWESHLFGGIAGLALAWFTRKVGVTPKRRYSWDDEPEHGPDDDRAIWNYQKNWSGSNQMYYPGDRFKD